MLLKRVKYHNFRPFIGDQEVDLTAPGNSTEKNVTIILGDNTYGKSTFVLSFVWCFYGESRFNMAEDILNKKIAKRLKFGETEKAWVEVEFEDDNKCYTMRRTQTFTKGQGDNISAGNTTARLTYVNEKGETKSLGQFQNEINLAMSSILPKDLSSFFFFEGEKNNEISKKDLGKSVRTLLGLEAFEKMRLHLFGNTASTTTPSASSVMGEYRAMQNSESDFQAQREYQKMIDAEAEIDSLEEANKKLEADIQEYENKINQINEMLRQAAPSRELQKRRDAIAIELAQENEALRKNYSKFFSTFSRESFNLLISPFLEKANTRLNEMDLADKGIKGIEAAAIHELLHRGVCLCGTSLSEGSAAYKNVEKYIDYIPPKSVGTLVRDMQETIESNEEKAITFAEDFEDAYKQIQISKTKIDSLEREDREKLDEISKIGNIDTTVAEENLISYKSKINEYHQDINRNSMLIVEKKSEKDAAEKNFNKLKSQNEKAREYQVYYKYAEAIYNWVNTNYSKSETNMRERLNKYVTELFNSMYSGKRNIKIDSKYNIIMRVGDDVVDDTGGLRVIQYFAYVGGLVKLAYEVMQERLSDEDGNTQALGEQYPLVLDAAFSHADEDHTRNISKQLANSVNQLVFALMRKDWAIAQDGLQGKISRMYELRKIDETEVRIEEVIN